MLTDQELLKSATGLNISATLDIELSEETIQGPLAAMDTAPPSAFIESVKLHAHVYLDHDGDSSDDPFRPLTEEELSLVILQAPVLRLKCRYTGQTTEHRAPGGRAFRLCDVLKAIEDSELQTRGETEWFGGIDVHHVFFEGLHETQDGSYFVRWGS